MINTFTIPEDRREDIQKTLARYRKKAEMYGVPMDVQFGEPYAKLIPVYENDGIYKTKKGEVLVEVFDLSIVSEIIRKEGYSVIARIEHLENGNVVNSFGAECRIEWTTMKPHCDHCNGNHGQRVTFIVRHEDGSEKQVGRTCLKDYCGIDPRAVGFSNELWEIMLDEDIGSRDFMERPIAEAYNTRDALALAVMIQRTKGYTPSGDRNSNKGMLGELMVAHEKTGVQDRETADEIAEAVLAMSDDDAFDSCLSNIKNLLECGYCKRSHFGYLAYAPLAYERYQKKLAKEAQRQAAKDAERASSQFIGEVGQRLVVEVADMSLLTSWEGDWGYTYLYKIIDTAGNVLIWYASRCIDAAKKIKATIKDHSERDGVKQTIVTRCSVVA